MSISVYRPRPPNSLTELTDLSPRRARVGAGAANSFPAMAPGSRSTSLYCGRERSFEEKKGHATDSKDFTNLARSCDQYSVALNMMMPTNLKDYATTELHGDGRGQPAEVSDDGD